MRNPVFLDSESGFNWTKAYSMSNLMVFGGILAKTLTKADTAAILHSELNLNKKESGEMLEALIEIVKETLESGERLKISGFGNFEVKQKHSRRGRNPQTGDPITIDARRVVIFRPSPVLREAINASTKYNRYSLLEVLPIS